MDQKKMDNCQVLVIDDDPACLEVVTGFLDRENITSRVMTCPQKALDLIRAGRLPNLILMDIMMPGLSGYDLCRSLRQVYPASELPIIMLTGKQEVDDLVTAYEAGANDYISKPFSKFELIARVRSNLGLQKAYETVKENLRLEIEVKLQKEKSLVARQAAEREGLEKLRYQINPHFLFNALASIRGAVFANPDAAHQMVSHLSDFCRLSLMKGGAETLTIERETTVISHYLAMEKMRFNDYLSVHMEIQPRAAGIEIPAFIIQPLVENAIKYGTRTSPDFLEVTIRAACRYRDKVIIQVTNTGEWVFPGPDCEDRSTGIAIRNIKARLNHFYPNRFEFRTEASDGRVSVSLVLPNLLS